MKLLLKGGGAAASSAINPLGAVVSGIPELAKLGLAGVQAIRGNKLGKTERPDYQVPEAMKLAMQTAQQQANDTRMPGQGLIEQQLLASQASGQRALNEAGMGGAERMAALAGLTGQAGQQQTNLGVQAANMQRQDLQGLQRMFQNMAPYQDKQWQWNQQQPYLDATDAARREKEASNQNMYSGLKGIGASVNSAITSPQDSQTTPSVPTPLPPSASFDFANQDYKGMDQDAHKQLNMAEGAYQPHKAFMSIFNPQSNQGGSPMSNRLPEYQGKFPGLGNVIPQNPFTNDFKGQVNAVNDPLKRSSFNPDLMSLFMNKGIPKSEPGFDPLEYGYLKKLGKLMGK